MPVMPPNFAAILGVELATRYFNDGQPNGPGTQLWRELQRREGDILAVKSGASAFFPGKCDLNEQLDPLGIDTLLIAGAVTNICSIIGRSWKQGSRRNGACSQVV
jgi:nicotinamidase-related amidase